MDYSSECAEVLTQSLNCFLVVVIAVVVCHRTSITLPECLFQYYQWFCPATEVRAQTVPD